MNYNALSQPLIWAALVLIAVLHILSALAPKRLSLPLTAVNFALHIAMICAMLYLRADPEELFFAMLLSAAAGLFSTKSRRGGTDGGI